MRGADPQRRDGSADKGDLWLPESGGPFPVVAIYHGGGYVPEVTRVIMEGVARDLSERYRGTFGKETVERYVRECYDLLAARPGTDRYLPSLAAQFAAGSQAFGSATRSTAETA